MLKKSALFFTLTLCALTTFANAAPVTVTKEQCQVLRNATRHVPDAGVNYTPGVDARGNAVAPADLNAPVQLPQTFGLDIKVDLHDRYGIPSNASDYIGELNVAHIDINPATGEAAMNGQPLTPQDQTLVRQACDKTEIILAVITQQ